MAKKNKKTSEPVAVGVIFRRAVMLLTACFVLVSAMVAYHRVGEFLIEDRRFWLGSPELSEDSSPDIRVSGIVNASRSKVMNAFAEDNSRSMALLPAEKRRLQLLAVDWVKDATVSRLWPNRVDVQIRERKPAAFVQLPGRGGGLTRIALIDLDGVILDPPEKSEYDLPVLTGLNERQSEAERAVRVRRAMRMMVAAGPIAKDISEVDVSDENNLMVRMGVEGKGVLLMLGNENYRGRLEHFQAHYPEIQRHRAEATTFDLRLEDRITALDGAEGEK